VDWSVQYTDYCNLDGKLVWHAVATTKDHASTRNIADWCAPRGKVLHSSLQLQTLKVP